MAQFDLKQATVFMRDGFSAAGAVNKASGYSIGNTVMAIDGFVGAVATGDKFLITGQTTIYNITGHSEILGNTVSVTFTPALTADVLDNAVITFYQPNVDTATVNNVSGYPIGTTTVLVTGFVGAVANGDIVNFAGQTTNYTITAHSETLGNTTSITFAPGLTAALVNTQVVTFYQPNVDTGAVNQSTGGYTAGATSISVSGLAQALETGDVFYLAGDSTNTKYKVTAHTEVLGNTVSVTFTPAIPATVTIANLAVITFGPHEIEVKMGEGNLTYNEKKARQYTLDRGKLDTVRNGDEAPVEIKLDGTWEWIRGATGEPPTPEDVVKRRGAAANWVSTSADECEPYSIDLVVEYRPECVTQPWEMITLPDFRYEEINHDTKAGTLSFTGKSNVTEANSTRIAA